MDEVLIPIDAVFSHAGSPIPPNNLVCRSEIVFRAHARGRNNVNARISPEVLDGEGRGAGAGSSSYPPIPVRSGCTMGEDD
jgi:hypothetical protein